MVSGAPGRELRLEVDAERLGRLRRTSLARERRAIAGVSPICIYIVRPEPIMSSAEAVPMPLTIAAHAAEASRTLISFMFVLPFELFAAPSPHRRRPVATRAGRIRRFHGGCFQLFRAALGAKEDQNQLPVVNRQPEPIAVGPPATRRWGTVFANLSSNFHLRGDPVMTDTSRVVR